MTHRFGEDAPKLVHTCLRNAAMWNRGHFYYLWTFA